MTCRTCKFLEVPPDKDGRRRPMKHSVYECVVEVSKPVLPSSMITYYSFKWPLHRKCMEPDDGKDCPCWQAST